MRYLLANGRPAYPMPGQAEWPKVNLKKNCGATALLAYRLSDNLSRKGCKGRGISEGSCVTHRQHHHCPSKRPDAPAKLGTRKDWRAEGRDHLVLQKKLGEEKRLNRGASGRSAGMVSVINFLLLTQIGKRIWKFTVSAFRAALSGVNERTQNE